MFKQVYLYFLPFIYLCLYEALFIIGICHHGLCICSKRSTHYTPLQAKEQLGHKHQSTTDFYIHSTVLVKVVEDRTNLLLKYKTA